MEFTLKGTDIVGYAFQAAVHCEECIRALAIRESLKAGSSYSWGDCGSAEQTLAEWASLIGLDRSRDVDTNEFPFPVFASEQSTDEPCDTCHQPLVW